jgi:hypothetical protein
MLKVMTELRLRRDKLEEKWKEMEKELKQLGSMQFVKNE